MSKQAGGSLLFRSRGNLANDAKYATSARVMTIDEMLSFRNTWKEKLTPDYDFVALLKDARTVKPNPSAAPLSMSENGYRVRDAKTMAEAEKTIRTIQSVLNKLAEKNYDELKTKVLQLQMLDDDVVAGVVKRIYDKALEEPAFSGLYAQLCRDIALYSHECQINNQPMTIDGDQLRKSLLTRAQATFEEMSHLSATDDAEVDKIRKKKLANIKFVGELFHGQLLKPRVIVGIIAEIFNTESENPQPPSLINAEVGLELLNVVGKELDRTVGNTSRIWETIRHHQSSSALGKRLTFLYQNLLDWQASGWAPKKEEVAAAEAAAAAAAAAAQAAAVAALQARPHIDHKGNIMSTSASATDLSAGASGESAKPSKDSKFAALARPPEAFNEEHARKVCSIVRDTIVDSNWEKTKQEFSTLLPGEAEHSCRMACFFGLMTQLCQTARESERSELVSGITNPIWEPSEVCRGVAWALTDAICKRTVEDCPKYYDRFAAVVCGPLASSAHIPIQTAVKDVFARTANYLDALFPVMDGSPEWDVDFVTVWELYVKGCVEGGKNLPPIVDVLDALGSVRQTPFMRNILPDFVQTMISENLCTKDELEQWAAKHEHNTKVHELVRELKAMFL